jgi:hypothetical protein
MPGTNVGSSNKVPFTHIPDRGNRPHDSGERAASIIVEKVDGVFRHKELWLESRNNSETFAPQPAFIGFSFSLPCLTYRLARHACTDQINLPIVAFVWRECFNFAPTSDIGPMLCQNGRGVLIALYLPLAGHASTFEAKIKSADPCEERAEGHGHPFHDRTLPISSSESTENPLSARP